MPYCPDIATPTAGLGSLSCYEGSAGNDDSVGNNTVGICCTQESAREAVSTAQSDGVFDCSADPLGVYGSNGTIAPWSPNGDPVCVDTASRTTSASNDVPDCPTSRASVSTTDNRHGGRHRESD